MVERRFCTPEVSGSIPLGSTMKDKGAEKASFVLKILAI